MFKRTVVAAALALALASGAAQAVSVVDTGTPSNQPGYRWQFNQDQYFAGEFSLLDNSIINSIQGYFSTASGVVGISVYSDGGSIPGSALFSTNLTTTAGGLAWNGVSDLNWSLNAGTYWVAFAPDYTTFGTTMPGAAPSPLAAYAQHTWGAWQEPADGLALGVRIDATNVAAPVPEPTTIAMYALGLAGLAVVARRKQA